jgi:hypothetical protein
LHFVQHNKIVNFYVLFEIKKLLKMNKELKELCFF